MVLVIVALVLLAQHFLRHSLQYMVSELDMEHPLVTWFLKGEFESHPSMRRYTAVWEVTQVLDHF